MEDKLVKNIHTKLGPPHTSAEDTVLSRGDYCYWHYRCDGFDDVGWGCGYRTLQTLCSWARHQLAAEGVASPDVPSIPAIQGALVEMGDKPSSFQGSREWMGCFEAAIIMDHFYDVPCKVIHIHSGNNLAGHTPELASHFRTIGAPVMMGGDTDTASKGIMGLCKASGREEMLMILDPHYYGGPVTLDALQDTDMLLWRNLDTFNAHSFYNLCLPQYKPGTHRPCNSGTP